MWVRGTIRWAVSILLLMTACGSDDPATGEGTSGGGPIAPPDTTAEVFGTVHSGSYNDGPVGFAEPAFAHNACAPMGGYPAQIQQLYGPYLGGSTTAWGVTAACATRAPW